MGFQATIFDLDGTLLDTLADIAHSANRVLQSHGYPAHPVDAYRQFVGEGIVMLFRRTLPAGERDSGVVARCVEGFRDDYGRNWNVDTRPYDGIPQLLDALAARSVKMAVLSNKPDWHTRCCADEYLSDWRFEAVLGQREGVPPKPDPAAAREIAELLGVPAERILYLGDTATDMQTARSAGMRAVGAAWGFRPVEELRFGGAEIVIQRPMDLVGLIDGTLPLPRRADLPGQCGTD